MTLNSGDSPLVTIIMPSFNAESMIAEAIHSVTDQSLPDWELLVIDDCSTDRTREVVSELASRDERIRLIALETNCGAPARPRNLGIMQARGSWIALLDCDDVWHARKLELQLAAMTAQSARFSCSRMTDFERHGDIDTHAPVPAGHTWITLRRQKLKGQIPASSVVCDTGLMKALPFNEDPEYKAVEDYECWLRVIRAAGPCLKLSAPLLFYRKSEGQISRSKWYMLGRIWMVHRQSHGCVTAAALCITYLTLAAWFRLVRRSL